MGVAHRESGDILGSGAGRVGGVAPCGPSRLAGRGRTSRGRPPSPPHASGRVRASISERSRRRRSVCCAAVGHPVRREQSRLSWLGVAAVPSVSRRDCLTRRIAVCPYAVRCRPSDRTRVVRPIPDDSRGTASAPRGREADASADSGAEAGERLALASWEVPRDASGRTYGKGNRGYVCARAAHGSPQRGRRHAARGARVA